MTETMLVRAAGGGWEELRPQTTMPDGGVLDVFGEDIGPVLGSPSPVIVAACQPVLSTGTPDAVCVDAEGGIWIVQLALDGTGDAILPQLLAFGGALTGMTYADFEAVCGLRGSDTLAEYVELRSGAGFDAPSFEGGIGTSLATGRLRLVGIVRDASPAVVQSMRFLNASGASGMLYEARSFSSSTVFAIRANAIDVGGALSTAAPAASAGTRSEAPAASGKPAAANAKSQRQTAPAPAPAATPLTAFLAATALATDEATAALVEQLHEACATSCDEIRIDGSGADAALVAVLHGGDGAADLIVAGTDGSIAISFEALAPLDPSWSVRAELCQGMERLLGADLGEVRKISQLNLTVAEHLMDATLMDAMLDLVRDACEGVSDARAQRTPAAA